MVTALNPLSFAALLLHDRDSVCFAVELGDRLQRMMPGTANWVDIARHRLGLLDGRPSIMHPDLLERHGKRMADHQPLPLAGQGREPLTQVPGTLPSTPVSAPGRDPTHIA